MASCMHHGEGCSPKGTPLYKCAGYFECSFGCENYVCENHAHQTRYGMYCEQCAPTPPVFDMPRAVKSIHHLAANGGMRSGIAVNR